MATDEAKLLSAEDTSSSVTSAERIRDLISLDKDVTGILFSAGKAVKALTDAYGDQGSRSTDTSGLSQTSIEMAKQDFTSHTTQLYTLVQSVTAGLRRQAYALEEANIIASQPVATEMPGPQPLSQLQPIGRPGAAAQVKVEPPTQLVNGGLGNFDIGWLNSRRDEVGKRKEAELWAEARARLEKLEAGFNKEHEHDEMELDMSQT